MKAMMSERLRSILNDPASARELQKQLSASDSSAKAEKREASDDRKSLFSSQSNRPHDQHPKK